MYPAISLYPNGGAFMICESVGEFDPNVPPPSPEEIRKATPSINYDDDPIAHFLSKLRPVYEQVVKPMLSAEYLVENPDDAIALYNQAARGVSDIASAIRNNLMKLEGMCKVFECEDTCPTREKFESHVGLFMKNLDVIRRQGIEYHSYNVSYHPGFYRRWDMSTFIDVCMKRPQFMDRIITFATMKPFIDLGSDSKLITSFENTLDLLQCVFDDPGRMARLEAQDSYQLSIDDLMRHFGYNDDCGICEGSPQSVSKKLLVMVSKTVREVSRCCYDSQCDLCDTPDSYPEMNSHQKCISNLLSQCVNLFAFGVMVCMYYATNLRIHMARKKAVDSYTDLLISTLKTV